MSEAEVVTEINSRRVVKVVDVHKVIDREVGGSRPDTQVKALHVTRGRMMSS
jgi:hypothetical protein